jgi:hypothetical protein
MEMTPGGFEGVATLPEPMIVLSPMVTPGLMVTPPPIQV